jgi:regulator of protease activity HflC (stomatin/prohibitin superfamily)
VRHRADKPGQSVDAAFNRVLRAEQDARDAVSACAREAEAIATRAEQRSRAIVARAERRIRNAHAIADRGVARALAALRVPAEREAALDPLPTPEQAQALAAALARELTEGPSGAPGADTPH